MLYFVDRCVVHTCSFASSKEQFGIIKKHSIIKEKERKYISNVFHWIDSRLISSITHSFSFLPLPSSSSFCLSYFYSMSSLWRSNVLRSNKQELWRQQQQQATPTLAAAKEDEETVENDLILHLIIVTIMKSVVSYENFMHIYL